VTAALRASIGAPERWTYTGQSADGTLSIVADAALTVPNALALPVANAELREFTQEDIDKAVSALFGDGLTWYDGNTFTKEWVEERLIEEQASLAALDPNDGEYEFWKSKGEEGIKHYQEMYESAPYEADLPVMGTAIRTITQGNNSYSGVVHPHHDRRRHLSLRMRGLGAEQAQRHGRRRRQRLRFVFRRGVSRHALGCFPDSARCRRAGQDHRFSTHGRVEALPRRPRSNLQGAHTAQLGAGRAYSCARSTAWGTMYTCEDVGSDMESDVQYPVRYERSSSCWTTRGPSAFGG